MQTLLRVLADHLDSHYNRGLFGSRGSLTEIESLRPVFYVSCRKVHTRLYSKLGFNVVNDLRTKKALRTPSGLYIMNISASEIISRFGDHSLHPLKKGEEPKVATGLSARELNSMWFEGLESSAPKVVTKQDFEDALRDLNIKRRLYFHTDKNSTEFRSDPEVKNVISFLAREKGSLGLDENTIDFALYGSFFQDYYKLAYSALKRLPADQAQRFEALLEPYRQILLSHRPDEIYQELLEKSKNNEPLLLPFVEI